MCKQHHSTLRKVKKICVLPENTDQVLQWAYMTIFFYSFLKCLGQTGNCTKYLIVDIDF